MKNLLAGSSLLALLASAGALHAAAAPAAPAAGPNEVEEVIVTGTRETGIKAADSPAPIQLVGHTELLKTGTTDLAQTLTIAVPGLNISTNNGDAAAVQVLAALRGLSPNETLILVDGKRRHTTSNLAIDTGSVYTGSDTTDLSFIPVDAIDHVEVLTDGAAAQYGSDAIAGVINIILKHSSSGGGLDATGGEYYNGQGASADVQLNHGFNLWDKGFLNVTLEERYHDFSTLGVGDSRVTDSHGTLLPNLGVNAGVANFPGFPHVNLLNGDPAFNLYNSFYNMGYDITPEVEFYSFGSFSYREAQHYENIRLPNKVEGMTSTGETVIPFPHGFDPKEKFDERDYSFTAGIRGKIDGWHWDLSTTYGGNHTDIYVVDSGNAQLFPLLQAASPTPIAPQTTFYNGAFDATEWTTNLDIDRSFNVGFAAPLNVAFGVEERRDTYGVTSGEPSSYFGAGAQSFDGYTPFDQGNYARTNTSVYFDVATDPIKNLHVDLAGRFEHYSDFGSTEVGKATARYDFSPAFAIRGTVSSGFRAPTLAEEHYSGTNVSPYSADVVIPANSAAAQSAGFAPLKPEQSINYSVGFVAHPMDRMQVTADFYYIELHNRILESGFLYYQEIVGGNNVTVSPGVGKAIANRGVTLDSGLSYSGISLFANSANTRTEGVDVTANYSSDFGDYGHVDWTVGFNWDKTTVTKLDLLPADIQNAAFAQTTYFTASAITALTSSTPREKAILNAYWTLGRFSLNGRLTVNGPASQFSANNAVLETIGVTPIADLDIGYRITKAIRFDIGANDLFNTRPPLANNNGTVYEGGRVFSVPYGFAAWNANGGYYYGRIQVSF